MNKYKQLTKKTAKTGVGAAIVVGICAVFYVGLSMYAETVAKQKSDVESKVTTDQGLLGSLKDQMNKSGEAEKRYASLQENRTTQSYSSSLDQFFDFLRQAKGRYQLTQFNRIGKPPKETVSDKPELAHFKSYDVMTRPLKFQFNAVSDLHVFSFLDDIKASAPGMVRVDMLSIKRASDLNEVSFNNLATGASPLLVDAKLDITLITIVPKEQKEEGATPTAQPPAGVPAP
jgi:hypothetical protein